jgi:hypothetical protein
MEELSNLDKLYIDLEKDHIGDSHYKIARYLINKIDLKDDWKRSADTYIKDIKLYIRYWGYLSTKDCNIITDLVLKEYQNSKLADISINIYLDIMDRHLLIKYRDFELAAKESVNFNLGDFANESYNVRVMLSGK